MRPYFTAQMGLTDFLNSPKKVHLVTPHKYTHLGVFGVTYGTMRALFLPRVDAATKGPWKASNVRCPSTTKNHFTRNPMTPSSLYQAYNHFYRLSGAGLALAFSTKVTDKFGGLFSTDIDRVAQFQEMFQNPTMASAMVILTAIIQIVIVGFGSMAAYKGPKTTELLYGYMTSIGMFFMFMSGDALYGGVSDFARKAYAKHFDCAVNYTLIAVAVYGFGYLCGHFREEDQKPEEPSCLRLMSEDKGPIRTAA